MFFENVDWLCGLAEEPDRLARIEVGDLPRALADYVAARAAPRILKDSDGNLKRPGHSIFAGDNFRVDGTAIIDRAIASVVECIRSAHEGLAELSAADRQSIAQEFASHPRFFLRKPGQSDELHSKVIDTAIQHRKEVTASVSRQLERAKFVRRVKASDAPLIDERVLYSVWDND